VVLLPAILLIAMVFLLVAGAKTLPTSALLIIEMILTAALLLTLSFFRDPHRIPPQDKKLLLAPADGKITNIETTVENSFLNAPACKISIFLSIFNPHINRAPCNAKVEEITYKKGSHKDARNPQAPQLNESNDLALIRTDFPNDKVLVRQISGAIARRIVCQIKPGQELTGGQKFGMIKFGSRTELYVPANESVKCLVKIGDKVKAGLTPLLRYE
jgi:phosphatidylserine decarboxylase